MPVVNKRGLSYLEIILATAVLVLVLSFAVKMNFFSARVDYANQEQVRLALAAAGAMEDLKAGENLGTSWGRREVSCQVQQIHGFTPAEITGLTRGTDWSKLGNMNVLYLKLMSSRPDMVEDFKLISYQLRPPQFPYLSYFYPNWQEYGRLPASDIVIRAENYFFSPTCRVSLILRDDSDNELSRVTFSGNELEIAGAQIKIKIDQTGSKFISLPADKKYDLEVTSGSDALELKKAYWVKPASGGGGGTGETPPEPNFTFQLQDWHTQGSTNKWVFDPANRTITHRAEDNHPLVYRTPFYIYNYQVYLIYRESHGRDKEFKGGITIGRSLNDNNAVWFYMDRSADGKIALYLAQGGGSGQLLLLTSETLQYDVPYFLQAVAFNDCLTLKFNGKDVKQLTWSTSLPSYLGLKDEAQGVEIIYRFP